MHDTVEVQRNETERKGFAFVNAMVSLTSEPAGADILVDNKTQGKLRFGLNYGVVPTNCWRGSMAGLSSIKLWRLRRSAKISRISFFATEA